VLARIRAFIEMSRGLNDDLRAERWPINLRWVAYLENLDRFASDKSESTLAATVFGRFPKIESYFSRCARVLGSVPSFTATISMEGCPSEARRDITPDTAEPVDADLG